MTVLNFDGFLRNQRLVWLDVSSNLLTSLQVPNGSLKLKTLLLGHNHLTNISDLQRLTQLATLDVSGNQLYDLGDVNFRALQILDISQNSWDCRYLEQLKQYLKALNILTPVREAKTEVVNSLNVDGIGCSGLPPSR
jgi:Leucine-rich repeat (LRR) protein